MNHTNYISGRMIDLNDNGAWSWFMDERVIVHRGKLLVGSIRSTAKSFREGVSEPAWGNCELAVYDLATGAVQIVVLHEHFEQDDHNGPALHVRPDGRVLAVYTKHSFERVIYWRVSESEDLLTWSPEKLLVTPGVDHPPFGGDNTTYTNLFQIPAEGNKLYNFHRSVQHQQNWMTSDDNGDTWNYRGMFLKGYAGYAPYFKYATNDVDTIHFIGTEDHPRQYDNSVYHGFVRGGVIYQSDGTPYKPLSTTTDPSGFIWDLTCVYRGGPGHVAWVTDLHLDAQGHPACVFTVQIGDDGLPRGQGGDDHRFHYARWDGRAWTQHEIAYAGKRLYPHEDDYTGLAAIDPRDTSVVYISTDADPITGVSLISRADGQRHHELYRGKTTDGGATWKWESITSNSDTDNLRPIIPIWDDPRLALVWMRGHYHANRGPWSTKVVAMLAARK